MTSTNHQFTEYEDEIFARYRKTVNSIITGTRLHPRTQDRIPFLLESSEEKFNIEHKVLEFDYATDVLEIYSETEDKTFRKLNTYLFKEGLLIAFDGEKEAVMMVNALSDTDIDTLASATNLKSFEKKINSITSLTTLQRLKAKVEEKDRKLSFIKAVESRIAAI